MRLNLHFNWSISLVLMSVLMMLASLSNIIVRAFTVQKSSISRMSIGSAEISVFKKRWMQPALNLVNDDFNDGSEDDGEEHGGNVNIPKTGISVNDEMMAAQSEEKFITQLTPLPDHQIPVPDSVAIIETFTSETVGSHPLRYVVALDPPHDEQGVRNDNNAASNDCEYAMIDVPPFSQELVEQIQSFLNPHLNRTTTSDDGDKQKKTRSRRNGKLTHILVTSKENIHYDESPSVYVTRKSDLQKWKQSFPAVNIVTYRLDTPRDCREEVTQILDGYGPWALHQGDIGTNAEQIENTKKKEDDNVVGVHPSLFIETGRPLTRMEWDEEVQTKVLDNGEVPPDDIENSEDDDEKYAPDAIKERELHKKILAVYTPGHTFGSLTYIFPNIQSCCSGYTLPVEDTIRQQQQSAGPALDYKGYLTTNRGGIDRQMESARFLVRVYGDRFEAVLPSKGSAGSSGVVWIQGYGVEGRARIWEGVLKDFEELGRVYEQLGIIT